MTERFEQHITAEIGGVTAIELLAEHTGLSKQLLKKAMSNGAVWLESNIGINRIRRAKKPLRTGDKLHLYFDSHIQSQTAPTAVLVADEGDYSIWNKPGGMYSQGSKWGDHCTIYRWAEQHLQPSRPAYLVHRLDRAASGLIIIAHNKKTANAFAQMFKQHTIRKRYRATVAGTLADKVLPFSIDQPLDEKAAETVILQADFNPDRNTTDLLIEIRTGRKHQIRRHLSSLGHPIVGDRLYGTEESDGDLQLRSVYLAFNCPVTKTRREYSLRQPRVANN
jgi:tRNA pseudouridine32 synthase/23S rRNA pseudouridine746 synthase